MHVIAQLALTQTMKFQYTINADKAAKRDAAS